MNRATRRKRDKVVKGQAKQKFTMLELQKAIVISQEMKKASKGHLFEKTLGERCIFCGVTRKTRKECDFWFLTFLDRLQTILVNPQFFSADDIEAIWFQHGEQYDNIQIPLLKASNGKKA